MSLYGFVLFRLSGSQASLIEFFSLLGLLIQILLLFPRNIFRETPFEVVSYQHSGYLLAPSTSDLKVFKADRYGQGVLPLENQARNVNQAHRKYDQQQLVMLSAHGAFEELKEARREDWDLREGPSPRVSVFFVLEGVLQQYQVMPTYSKRSRGHRSPVTVFTQEALSGTLQSVWVVIFFNLLLGGDIFIYEYYIAFSPFPSLRATFSRAPPPLEFTTSSSVVRTGHRSMHIYKTLRSPLRVACMRTCLGLTTWTHPQRRLILPLPIARSSVALLL